MPGENDHNHLWYTRRNGVVRGPFPTRMITSFILLGRINEADELSRDREQWMTLTELPELVPEVMRHMVTEEDRQRLLIARMHEDERLADNRRHRASEAGSDQADVAGRDQRQGDRRAAEPTQFCSHRKFRSRLTQPLDDTSRGSRLAPLLLGVCAILVLGLSLYVYMRQPISDVSAGPDCAAPAAPAVNWSYCHREGANIGRAELSRANLSNASLVGANLQGAHLGMSDMSYANFGAANLRNADLRSVNMKGAELHNADLAGSDLTDADLSYANLLGAKLDGAILKNADLSKATWVDGRRCALASVGQCR